MTSPADGRKGLAGHGQALSGLLDALLSEPATRQDARSSQSHHEGPPVDAPLPADPVGLNDPAVSPIEEEAPSPADQAAVVPVWAEGGFRALLFRIGGYRFAVPLVLMRGIVSLPDQITRVPGQPAWHLGLIRYREQSLVVADFGLLTGVQARCTQPRHLLRIGDGDVAIVCDGIEDTVGVAPQGVRWARPGNSRAWLAGLLTDQMCVLLDTDALSSQIRHG